MFHKGLLDVFLHIVKNDVKTLPGVFKSIAKVTRDMGSYAHFMDIIISHLNKKPNQFQVVKMVQEIIKIESVAVDNIMEWMGSKLSLGANLVAVDTVKMRLKWHGDNCLSTLGYPQVFKTKDPLPWIEELLKKEARLEDGDHNLTRVIATPKKTAQKSMESVTFKLDEDF